VTEDADLRARGMLYRLPQGDGESLQVAMPLQFSTMQPVVPQSPPRLPASDPTE
jgi:crotonobetainyl-CoA:carnitine CoA-transferase CaiB-like acyl-CoA transferase